MSTVYMNWEQGSDAWLQARDQHLCASDAPAMLGLSKYKKREEYLLEKLTGEKPPVSEFTQRLFDKGHEAEEHARATAEVIGECDFEPAVAVFGEFLASLDGLSPCRRYIWEHKLENQSLADFILEKRDLPDTHWPQCEHQLMVTGAEHVLFTVSDGGPFPIAKLIYRSQPERLKALVDGWKQFTADLITTDPDDLRVHHREDEEWVKAAQEYRFLKTESDNIAKKMKDLKTKLDKLADGKKSEGGGVAISFTTRTTYDNKAIHKDYNVDLPKYAKTSTSSTLRLIKED